MTSLADQLERDRFVTVHGKNISVIAPAGVGKTHAIVQRIVHLAREPEEVAADRLARLIVVTYSVRAAQEMQQRARSAIRESGVSSRVQRAFQQTFFGTIHSYCVRLLDRFGHHLGLPSPLALLQNDEDLWNRFLTHGMTWDFSDHSHLQDLFHFYAPEKLYGLGKIVPPGKAAAVGSAPEMNVTLLLDYSAAGLHPSTRKSVVNAQAAVRRWSEAWARGDRFHPLPKCPKANAPEFLVLWDQAFAPLQRWLREAALAFGRGVANAYETFRFRQGVMTYDDQVRMALRVVKEPAVRRELAEDRLSVLLDEAQDTDPLQFELLLQVAGLGKEASQGGDQSLATVGDFQQAIYAPRSNLGTYQRIHDEVTTGPRGASSLLQVTFRCDQAIIDFVNRVFASLLNAQEGQAAFTRLMARHDAGPGQVARWRCPAYPEDIPGKKIKVAVSAEHEARWLAQEIKARGLPGLGVRHWRDVAILCPRKEWLLEVQRELLAAGLPVQLHSASERQGDNDALAWMTSLIWIAAHPEDSFEIAGVLREIFGVSDDAMARYTQRDGEKLRVDRECSARAGGPVAAALRLLQSACANAERLPLHALVQRLLDHTQLEARLISIHEAEAEETARELDGFHAAILGRCAQGLTLAELAKELRSALTQVDPAEEEVREAIQLLTSHKAKGLEWPTVIVPFVFRSIGFKHPPYPRLVQNEQGEEVICRNEIDFASEAKTFIMRRERQQLQRLLYVMCTRAKRTLLLVDDEKLFDAVLRRGVGSAGELLGFFSGINRITWEALPESFESPPDTPKAEPAPEPALAKPVSLSRKALGTAVQRARAIPRRISPHALAVQPAADAEPEMAAEREDDSPGDATSSPGMLYGTWWHEFMETIPWSAPRPAWQRSFEKAVQHSPQRERSFREWDLFTRSPLAAWLAQPGRIVHLEFPFLWLDLEQICLEGVMDLAVYTEAEASWRVIDWKTNRTDRAGSGQIVEIYGEQIRAYVRALQGILSAEVRGSVYLTATGEWKEVE